MPFNGRPLSISLSNSTAMRRSCAISCLPSPFHNGEVLLTRDQDSYMAGVYTYAAKHQGSYCLLFQRPHLDFSDRHFQADPSLVSLDAGEIKLLFSANPDATLSRPFWLWKFSLTYARVHTGGSDDKASPCVHHLNFFASPDRIWTSMRCGRHQTRSDHLSKLPPLRTTRIWFFVL